MQATENTGLVVFGRVEVRDYHIIGICEGNMTGRTTWSLTFALTRELAAIRAIDAEDVAEMMVSRSKNETFRKLRGSPASCDNSVVVELLAAFQHVAAQCMLHRNPGGSKHNAC
jgi:hypothetical protein